MSETKPIISQEIILANPTVWEQSINSANGDIDSVSVKAEHIINAKVGDEWGVSGGGSLWSMSKTLKCVYRTDDIVVCEDVYIYSDSQNDTHDVVVRLFQL